MESIKNAMLLYAVTSDNWNKNFNLLQKVEAALRGGITALQLREKNLSDDEFLAKAREIAALCKDFNVPLIINDNLKVAKECGADGLHIGQDDICVKEARKILGDKMILGVSAHNLDEALIAQGNGADYLGVGAVFGTTTKENARSVDFTTLKQICNAVKIPIVAIGGISKNNISHLIGSGIVGVAVVSAIFALEDLGEIERESAMLLESSKQYFNTKD